MEKAGDPLATLILNHLGPMVKNWHSELCSETNILCCDKDLNQPANHSLLNQLTFLNIWYSVNGGKTDFLTTEVPVEVGEKYHELQPHQAANLVFQGV